MKFPSFYQNARKVFLIFTLNIYIRVLDIGQKFYVFLVLAKNGSDSHRYSNRKWILALCIVGNL